MDEDGEEGFFCTEALCIYRMLLAAQKEPVFATVWGAYPSRALIIYNKYPPNQADPTPVT